MEKAKVYFTKEISPETLVKLYDLLGVELPGKTMVKVHTGEKGNQNFIKPEFFLPMVQKVNGTVCECNTAYDGVRWNSEQHRALLEEHGWTKYYDVDLMDEEGPDLVLPVKGGKQIQENFVGNHLANYDSILVLSHFKGHPMGGFGGALKQLSIGCASSEGKAWIHSCGQQKNMDDLWEDGHALTKEPFMESMAEAASTVVKYFEGKVAFINTMCNLSVDCDCCAVAEDPCMADIGTLASTDPVALDKACLDLVYASKDPGRDHLIERIESRCGNHIIPAAVALGYGTDDYELVCID